ncbi:pentapeptide repeat-containing protein [Actinoplanes sp. TBRC 11911]|nr:pentapeptide repeat-containing protein [Actinoplanes sp. TBRC 11911]
MQLLTKFVQDRSNYDGDTAKQQDGAGDALQVLTAFIQDLSTPTSRGLPDYLSPQPVVVSRAMNQVKKLDSDAMLGVHSTDISRANLHGISLPYFRPNGAFLGVAVDFRRANLRGLALRADENTLRRAFFTCASLNSANLGDADLQYADLTGADLRGANLSRTRNLRSGQLTGVMVDGRTKLPAGVSATTKPWGYTTPVCVATVNRMTGMIAGQGYDPALMCPRDQKTWKTAAVRTRFIGVLDDLIAVCGLRQPKTLPAS